MALFHLSVTQTKRSAGQSAIASAAYRAGERLYSEYYGEYSDYTRKGGVICSDILLPSHAPKEYADRQTLTSIVGLLISIYDPLPEYYGTAVSVAIWVFSLWVLKKIRNFYIAGKETTTIEKKFDFVAFFVCFPVVTYLAPQISSYQIDGVTSGCFGIQLVWCLKLLYIQFHDPEGNTPE